MKIGDIVTPTEDMFIRVHEAGYSAWSSGDIGMIVKVGQFQDDDGFVYVTFDGGGGWVLDDEIVCIEQ